MSRDEHQRAQQGKLPIPPEELERCLGLAFRRKELLRQALVHRSYLNENPLFPTEANERLELLGDAFIGLVVAEALYRRYPRASEGEMTEWRARVVNGAALARVSASLGLGQYLWLGTGEERSGGRQRPSIMASCLEALTGALLLDRGYRQARRFCLKVLADELQGIASRRQAQDPKSELQELVQARGKPPPVYQTLMEEGPGHRRCFVVQVLVGGEPLGQGSGPRRVEAEREAARLALHRLKGGPPWSGSI